MGNLLVMGVIYQICSEATINQHRSLNEEFCIGVFARSSPLYMHVQFYMLKCSIQRGRRHACGSQLLLVQAYYCP